MFFLDTNFRLTQIAGSLAEWLDRDPETLVGEPVTTLIAPSDVNAVRATLARVVESQTSQTIACNFLVAGDRRPVEIELSPVASEASLGTLLGTVHRDTIPDERQPSQVVQLRNFIELLDDAAVVYELVDTDPLVQSVNRAFEETFGYQAEYVVGESLNDYIVPPEHEAEAARVDQQVADGSVTTEVVRRQTANGVQQFAYRGLPIEYENGRQYGLAIYADITEEVQARQHLRVLHRVLRHNVRNELTVIFGMADRILAADASEEVQSAASQIIDSAEGLAGVSEKARMAEDILGDPATDTVVDVATAVTDVVADARSTWPDASVEIDLEQSLPVSTGLEIRDALENLVENAVVHNTDTPTVRVTARTETPIHASTRGAGRNVRITVEDDGPGIPEHEQAVIFDGANITQLKHGSGLGLWVVRWIVESADGAVSYSRADGWTTITLRLPLATDVGELNGSSQANQDSL